MLSYGGVPLTLPTPRQVEWLSSTFTLRRLFEFSRLTWPGPRTPWLTWGGVTPDEPLKLGCLNWPRGASRFATFFAVVSDAVLDAIRTAGAPSSPLPLVMRWDDEAHGTTPGIISTDLWMLPALPLTQIGGEPGHSLLTLVDDRYWWWFKPTGVLTADGTTTTWDQLYQQLAGNAGIPLAWDAINPAYLLPSALFTSNYEYLPLLLDAVAYNVGQRIVSRLDGTAYGRSVLQGAADVAANLALPAARSLLGGGAFLPSDVLKSIPAAVLASFPWLADDVVQPTPFVASALTGGTADATKVFHDSAAYDGSNAGILSALARRIATDFGAASTQVGDWKFAGIVPWVPDVNHDAVEWVYAGEGGPLGAGEVSTRILPGPWNDLTDQLLHGSEAGSRIIETCCTTTINNNTVTVVNDCNLTVSPGNTTGLVINLCDHTINFWTGFNWLTFCVCATSYGGSSGGSYGGGGPCVPGVCVLCPNPPFIYTLDVAGFTGGLTVLNGHWVLVNTGACRWSTLRVVDGVTYYASLVVSASDVALGFLDLTNGTSLATYHSGEGPAGDCCPPFVTLALVDFDHTYGGDRTGSNCPAPKCQGGESPSQWSVLLANFTGNLAWANRAWSPAESGVCTWIDEDAHGNQVEVQINADGSGDYYVQLFLHPLGSLFSAFYTGFPLAEVVCCAEQEVADPDFGTLAATGPAVVLISASCGQGDNNAPSGLQAVPTCCPGGGGSGSGGSVITTCCPDGLPAVLFVTFTGSMASLGKVRLDFDGTAWKSVPVVGACIVNGIQFACAGGPGLFRLTANGFAFFNVTATGTCSPWSWSVSGTQGAGVPPPCTTGIFTATVTLT